MANYLLHNLGYDKPINFRYIVLDTLKRYGICQHVRDYSTGQLGLTDVNKWLESTEYYENKIKRSKEMLKEYKATLKQIEAGDESYIQAEYEKLLSNAKSLRSSEHSYHIDYANKISKCAEEYYKYLSQFHLPVYGELGKNLRSSLCEIYNTAILDRDECLENDKKSVEQMHQAKDPIYEDVKVEVIDRLKGYIEWQEREIKGAKECIKRIKENNEIIKDIFHELDLVEKRVGDENERLSKINE